MAAANNEVFEALSMLEHLHNPALVQYADFIGMLDGTQSVGHCHGGTGLHQSLQGKIGRASCRERV